MSEIVTDVHWLAVLTGAVVAFFVGWLWYSPKLFGRQWADGMGVELTTKPPMDGMITQVVGLFLLSWFVGVMAVQNALYTVILITIAMIVLGYAAGSFAKNSVAARLINEGYLLASVAVMVLAQGLFGAGS